MKMDKVGKKHIIELNGQLYDALTGKIISSINTNQKAPSSIRPYAQQNMDGIARRKQNKPEVLHNHQRSTEKSHTLMRKTVHKPINHKLNAVATIIDTKPFRATKPTQQVTPAKAKINNGLIRKFSPTLNEVTAKPLNSRADSVKTRPANEMSQKAATTALSVVVSPLDEAIANATSHQQPKLKRLRQHSRLAHKLRVNPKIISAASVSLALMLIAVFFGYQNIPNLQMRLASNRAGMHGTLPAYQPPGFRLQDISYKTGEINISFHSNSDTRNFNITQVASSWNSDTLREKLKTSGLATLPVEVADKGKTLFIYNDSNVSWVDGGILYKIEGDSKLNSDQLLHLANSL